MAHFRPGSDAVASSVVELSVSCRNLVDKDLFSKSDPMCVLFVKEFGCDIWLEYERTEVIRNNLNPEWTKTFTMNYFFQERQYLKFEIFDVDADSPDLSKHDFMGGMICTLGELVCQRKSVSPLVGGMKKSSGRTIIICSQEMDNCKQEFTFRFEGRNLDKKKCCGKSDPFLAFHRVNADGTIAVTHRTEHIKNCLNPVWKEFTVPVHKFCGGNYDRPILVKCFSWNRYSEADFIGEFRTTVEEMSKVANGQPIIYTLMNPKLKSKKGILGSGQVALVAFRVDKMFSFIDFVMAGTQINVTIAIDFTLSNGNPKQKDSLHFMNPMFPNQYQAALEAVGEIIQDYDTDKLFPVLGFGAEIPPSNQVLFEFPVNGSTENPYCAGIQGVVAAYQACLMNIKLAGPTNFSPCINHVASFAARQRNGSHYFILLIITDGVISDMSETKEAIVAASVLPLSIIIVGVGNADFDEMKELDGDIVKLSYKGRYTDRDIVQFVAFRDFIKAFTATGMFFAKVHLAKQILAEIPEQFLSYMRKNRIYPSSWRQV